MYSYREFHQGIAVKEPRRKTVVDSNVKSERSFRLNSTAEASLASTGNAVENTSSNRRTEASDETGLESLIGETGRQPVKRFNRIVDLDLDGSEAASELSLAKKPEEVRIDLQV
jgi:hypothetical protein